MSNDQAQIIDPQQQATIETIISQEAPGKGKEGAAEELGTTLNGLDNEALLELLSQAYKEDPVANNVVIRKTTALLKDRGAEKEAKSAMSELRSQSFRGLLGEWLGGKLHDAIADQIAPEALLEHAQKALGDAGEKLPGLVEKIGLDKDGTAALEKLAAALTETAVGQADEYLQSEGGQELLASISNWVDENPGYVVTAIILAAVGAVVADMDIPELKQTFKIADGLTANVAANLGSLRNIAFEAAKLDVQYVKGQFTAKAGVSYDKDKGTSGNASLRYGDKKNYIETTGSIDPEGNLVVGLNAAFKRGDFSGGLKASHDTETDISELQIGVRRGDEENFISADAKGNSEGKLSANLGAGFQRGLWDNDFAATYDQDKGFGATNSLRYGTENRHLQLDNAYSQEGLSSTLSGAYQLNDNFSLDGKINRNAAGDFSSELGSNYNFEGGSYRNYFQSGANGLVNGHTLSLNRDNVDFSLSAKDHGFNGTFEEVSTELGFKPSDFAEITLRYGREQGGLETAGANLTFGTEKNGGALDYDFDGSDHRLGGEYNYASGNWTAGAKGTYNLTQSQIEHFSARLGFKDPNEFRSFSIEYAHNANEASTKDELKTTFESTLGSFMIRGSAGAATELHNNTGLRENSFNASLLGAHYISDNTALIAGGSVEHRFGPGAANPGTSFIPKVGVQYNDIPVTVGYDFDNKAVTVGLEIKF